MKNNPLVAIWGDGSAIGPLSPDGERLLELFPPEERDGMRRAMRSPDFAGLVRAEVRASVEQRAARRREEESR